MKLSNASQPTCTSTTGDVHLVYMYMTRPDTGTLLGVLNIAIILGVCVYVCGWVLVEIVQMCMRHLDFKFCFLSICEHTNLFISSFPFFVL